VGGSEVQLVPGLHSTTEEHSGKEHPGEEHSDKEHSGEEHSGETQRTAACSEILYSEGAGMSRLTS